MTHKTKRAAAVSESGEVSSMVRRVGKALAVGAGAALAMLGFIRVLRVEMFEDRPDLLLEQCAKTGLAVAALMLLFSLARVQRVNK